MNKNHKNQPVKIGDTYFTLTYAHPKTLKDTSTPCRALVNILAPESGKPMTKRQVTGADSDHPLDKPLYGADPEQIRTDLLPAAAAEILAQLALRRAEETSDTGDDDDLGRLAREFKDTLWAVHQSRWAQSTSQSYSRQYDNLAQALHNVRASTLTADIYRGLQELLCRSAMKDPQQRSAWTYGQAAPSTAQTQMYLLYLLIRYLKLFEGMDIPVTPFRYTGTPSHDEQLMDIIDSARSFDDALLRQLCRLELFRGQPGILADTGLRLREHGGLLFCSLSSINGSQGTMYYLTVTGQLQKNGSRTEWAKTLPSYRIVPLSHALGQLLWDHKTRLEQRWHDVSRRLLCAEEQDGQLVDDAKTARQYVDAVSAQIPALLRQPAVMDSLIRARAYTFDKRAQDEQLYALDTCHALRRNYCTSLYLASGCTTHEIYRLMGHAEHKNMKKRERIHGMPPAEIYRLCLKKHVSDTLYHPAHPLRYAADGPVRASEVPACRLELVLPPASRVKLTVTDTEPGNCTRLSGDGLHLALVRQDSQPKSDPDYALLASEEMYNVADRGKFVE